MENATGKTMENLEEIKETAIDDVSKVDDNSPTEESQESAKVIEDENNPLTEVSMRNLKNLLSQAMEMVKIMEAQWNSSKKEFQLTDSHMKQIYKFNEEHRTPMPDYLTEEQEQEWDHFNGLDEMTEEDVTAIFGEEHPIIGVMHTQTMDRIKDVTNEFFSWLTTLKEYRQIHDAYIQLLDEQEDQQMDELREAMEKEEDPEKKKSMSDALDMYYNRKYLDFLAEPLDDAEVNRLVNVFYDENRITYWLNRSRDKLKQMKISDKIILEISQFEKRFLPEEYHKLSNILLLHFMQTVIYANCSDKKDHGRNKALCMVLAFDKVIRITMPGEDRDRIMNNIKKFEDQFLDKIPRKEESVNE